MLTVSVVELLGSVYIKRIQARKRWRFDINIIEQYKYITRNIKELGFRNSFGEYMLALI